MAYIQAKRRKAAKRSFSLFAALLIGFLTCQFQFATPNPVTGRSEIAFITESEEIEIGEELFETLIEESGGRYLDSPELSSYVSDVGQKLAKLSDRPDLPYEFVIVNDDTLNAWALPGGKIAINTGLLKLLDNEAELAAILGHEITHAAARHSAERWERYTIKPAADALYAYVNPVYPFMIAAEFPDQMVESKYSRDAEHEADQYGLEYMARAGYHLSAAATVHAKLKEASDGDGYTDSTIDTFFSTHPNDVDRISHIKELTNFYPDAGKLEEKVFKTKTACLKPKTLQLRVK